MRYHTVIWDFNGTIADDVSLGIRCVNRMLDARGLPILTNADAYRRVFCFPVRDYYAKIGFDFEKESYETLAAEWVDLYTAGEHTLRLHDGFTEVNALLRRRGIRQILLTSSETVMLRRQMDFLGIRDCFDAVYGMDNFYAGGKIAIAKQCLGDEAKGAVVIGDTTHDAETAHAIGADCILFTGGHGEESALRALGCPLTDSLYNIPHMLD